MLLLFITFTFAALQQTALPLHIIIIMQWKDWDATSLQQQKNTKKVLSMQLKSSQCIKSQQRRAFLRRFI